MTVRDGSELRWHGAGAGGARDGEHRWQTELMSLDDQTKSGYVAGMAKECILVYVIRDGRGADGHPASAGNNPRIISGRDGHTGQDGAKHSRRHWR